MGIFKSYLEDRNYRYIRVFSQMVWPWSSRAAISQRCPQQCEIFTDYLRVLCKLMRRKRKHVWEALVHTSTSFLVLHTWKQMMRMQHHLRPTVSGVGAARGAVRDAGTGRREGWRRRCRTALCSPLEQKELQFGIFPPSSEGGTVCTHLFPCLHYSRYYLCLLLPCTEQLRNGRMPDINQLTKLSK